MKPILFSTPMVQAILAGRKTQTRRVIALPTKSKSWGEMFDRYPETMVPIAIAQAMHQPGDILWVRETWRYVDFDYVDGTWSASIQYKADMELGERIFWSESAGDKPTGWRSSRYMPRVAARLFLRVTDVKVERVQNISLDDAKDEGVLDPYDYQSPEYYEQESMRGLDYHISAFAGLWDSINAKRGYPWADSPWVWAYTFERIFEKEARG